MLRSVLGADAPDQGDPVADRQQDLRRSRIGGDVLVERSDRVARLEHLPAVQRVVGDDEAVVGEAGDDRLVVGDVAGLVRVHEHEIEQAVEARRSSVPQARRGS